MRGASMRGATMTEHVNSGGSTAARRPAPARPGRRPTTSDKIISAGLAATTCIGLVGIIAVRSQQEAAAQPAQTPSPATSSTGMTQQELDAYAASLAQQQQALNDYRDELAAVADQVQAIAAANGMTVGTKPAAATDNSGASKSRAVPVVQPKPRKPKYTQPAQPQVRPQAAPGLVQPQTSTRGS